MSWLKRLFGKPAPPPRERIVPAATVELPPADGEVRLYQDQVLRKAWAEDVLRAQNIPVNVHLPAIESEAEIVLRTPREVADRLHALVVVAFKASEAPDQALVDTIVAERGLAPHFTPEERAFIRKPAPDERARIRFSWRCEAA
jgi:hypothetical protein